MYKFIFIITLLSFVGINFAEAKIDLPEGGTFSSYQQQAMDVSVNKTSDTPNKSENIYHGIEQENFDDSNVEEYLLLSLFNKRLSKANYFGLYIKDDKGDVNGRHYLPYQPPRNF